MKTFRILYATVFGVVLLTALYSGMRVLFVLLFLQGLLLLAALAMNLWSAFTFAYVQEMDEVSSTRGETVHLHLEIHNERPFPYPMMRIRVRTLVPGKPWESTFNLAAHDHVSFDIPIPCLYRGEYAVGLSEVEIRDIFGLMVLPFRMERLPYYRDKKLLVHPRVTRLPEHSSRPPDAKAYVRFTALHTDNEESFSHTREYRPGDRARQIHWKLSARLGKLYSRQYDIATEPSMLVLLDASPGRIPGEAALQWQDTACSCAATLITHVLHQRYRVTLKADDRAATRVRGMSMAEYAAFDLAMSHLGFDASQPAARLLSDSAEECRDHGSIVLITHQEPDNELMDAFRAIRRPDTDLTLIVAMPAPGQPAITPAHMTERLEEEAADMSGMSVRILRAAYGDDLALLLGDFL